MIPAKKYGRIAIYAKSVWHFSNMAIRVMRGFFMDWDASHCPLPPIPNALKFLVMYNGYVCWFWWSHCRWYNILSVYIFTPMSKDIQSEWSICFRWETQLCFVTRRARVTNHGLAASDWGCQRLEMPLAFYWCHLPYDALWCCIMLYDAIWFRYITMVPNSRCGCFFLPTRRCLKMVDGVWSLKSQERVKRGCHLFLKQGVVAFYCPQQMPALALSSSICCLYSGPFQVWSGCWFNEPSLWSRNISI